MVRNISVVLFLFLVLHSFNTFGQDFRQSWIQYFPDVHTSSDRASDAFIDISGNVYITGRSNMGGIGSYIVTIKFNRSGQRVWTRAFHREGYTFTFPRGITVDNSGNVYVTGRMSHISSDVGDFVTIKYSSNGSVLWGVEFNGPDDSNDFPFDITQDEDENVYVTGTCSGTTSSFCTVKYNSAGQQEWSAVYDEDDHNRSRAIIIHNTDVYVTGYAWVSGQTEPLLVTIKYDLNGTLQWVRKEETRSVNVGSYIAVDQMSNIIVARGELVVKYDPQGNRLWRKVHQNARLRGVVVDESGNIIITYSQGIKREIKTTKYEGDGTELWSVTYSPSDPIPVEPFSLALDDNQHVYVVGRSGIDIIIIKYDLEDGTQKESSRYTHPDNIFATPVSIGVDIHGDIFVAGSIRDIFTGTDYIVLRYPPSGEYVWERRFRGEGGLSIVNDMYVDSDGNSYVTGSTDIFSGNRDFLTLKFNEDGELLWYVTYDGPANRWDEAIAIDVDSEGNVYVTGMSEGMGSGFDYATIKYNDAGEELWVARVNGSASEDDIPVGIRTDADGNVYVSGYNMMEDSYEDFTTVKYNTFGQLQWIARYDGGQEDRATAMDIDADGNVYATGWSRNPEGSPDVFTIKYDRDGNEVWNSYYNSPENRSDEANDIAVDAEGNVYVAGMAAGKFIVLKYDASGEEIWSATYEDPSLSTASAQRIAVDEMGNVYVSGLTRGAGTGDDITTIKYDAAGNRQWVSVYDGPANDRDRVTDMKIDTNGDVYITGYTRTHDQRDNFVTIKYNTDGVRQWVEETDYYGYNARAAAITVHESDNIYVAGSAGEGSWGVVIVSRYEQGTSVYVNEEYPELPDGPVIVGNFPNPFNNATTIIYSIPEQSPVTLRLFDILGREVDTLVNEIKNAGTHTLRWEPNGVPSGVYLCRLKSNGTENIAKIVYTK